MIRFDKINMRGVAGLILVILLFFTNGVSAQIQVDSIPLPQTSATIFLDAVTALNKGESDKARDLFYKVLEEDENNDAAYYYLASIAFANDEMTTGELLLKKAITIDSSNFWYQNMLGTFYASSKRTDAAIAHYEKLIEKFPKKTDIYYRLLNLYMEKGDVDKSTAVLDKIEQMSGKSEASVMTRLNIFRMMQNLDGALQYLVDAEKEVQSPGVQTMIGDLYAGMYKDSLAMVYYDKAIRTDSSYPLAIFGKAELLRKKGLYEEYFKNIIPFMANPGMNSKTKQEYIVDLIRIPGFANRYRSQIDSMISNCFKAHPTDSTMAYLWAAYYAQEVGDYDRGAEIMKANVENFPDEYGPVINYLSMLYSANRWNDLETECKKYISAYPDKYDILQLLGLSQYQLGKYGDAIRQYELLNEIALRGKDTSMIVNTYLFLGDLTHEIGMTKKSTDYYKKVLKLDPDNAHALNNFAYYMALDGKKLKKAYQMSLKSNEISPDNASFIDTRAWILYLMGDFTQAKSVIKKALLYGGNENPDVLDHYAEILYALKEYDLAFIYWEQAKSKDPENRLNISEKMRIRREAVDR